MPSIEANAALNARNFFATGVTADRPPLVFNQFGGNMGGPIFKDKIFFFGSYEGIRNAARFAFQTISTNRGNDDAVVSQITVTGFTAGWGDFFNSATKIRTYELRDVLTLDRGRHALRVGGEVRRLFKGLSIADPDAGTYTFTSIASFIADQPFRQTLTVNPNTGERTSFPRYFTQAVCFLKT